VEREIVLKSNLKVIWRENVEWTNRKTMRKSCKHGVKSVFSKCNILTIGVTSDSWE
jgi:hypothetical protein